VNHGLIVTKNSPNFIISAVTLAQTVDRLLHHKKTDGAKSEFESELANVQANATFGKTVERVRHRVHVGLICDQHGLTKAVSKVSFRQSEIIGLNDDLVMDRRARQTITLNKSISVGFTILEVSKLIKYTFFYE